MLRCTMLLCDSKLRRCLNFLKQISHSTGVWYLSMCSCRCFCDLKLRLHCEHLTFAENSNKLINCILFPTIITHSCYDFWPHAPPGTFSSNKFAGRIDICIHQLKLVYLFCVDVFCDSIRWSKLDRTLRNPSKEIGKKN